MLQPPASLHIMHAGFADEANDVHDKSLQANLKIFKEICSYFVIEPG